MLEFQSEIPEQFELGVILGVTLALGVTETLGVTLTDGVSEGVSVWLGVDVTLGEGVTLGETLLGGVLEGVRLGDGDGLGLAGAQQLCSLSAECIHHPSSAVDGW